MTGENAKGLMMQMSILPWVFSVYLIKCSLPEAGVLSAPCYR